jgi:hypothetical protein
MPGYYFNHRQTQILYNAPLRGATADINKADLALFYNAIGCRHTKETTIIRLYYG